MQASRTGLRKRVTRWCIRARARSRRPLFRQGLVDSRPVSIGIAAWGLVAGVALAKSGMGSPLAILMSVTVFAGSSQIAALPLIVGGAPIWVVWATVVCVNLRFLVFSYQYRPYFGHLPRWRRIHLSFFMGDTLFALFLRRYPEPRPASGQIDYFWGIALMNFGCWQLAIITGIVAGQSIPTEWGLGFAGTMALLALTCTQLHSRSTWVAAIVAACAAVAAAGLPLRLNIVVAIVAAIVVGTLAQRWRTVPAAGGSDPA